MSLQSNVQNNQTQSKPTNQKSSQNRPKRKPKSSPSPQVSQLIEMGFNRKIVEHAIKTLGMLKKISLYL